MKYKNIKSAIHNFVYSFISDENYVDDDYVFSDLASIHSQGHDITIDWLNSAFEPSNLCTERIQKSIEYWANGLTSLLKSQNVELESLKSLHFIWPANKAHFMLATDDRDVEHMKEVRYAS
jgi:hypothetical protein